MPISDLITKLMMIVIATLECHCHFSECNAKEAHVPEFEEWSDSSGESEEEKVIKEEEDDHGEGHLHRPESLKVMRTESSGQLSGMEIRGSFKNQPAIVEPVRKIKYFFVT